MHALYRLSHPLPPPETEVRLGDSSGEVKEFEREQHICGQVSVETEPLSTAPHDLRGKWGPVGETLNRRLLLLVCD